MVNFHTGMKCHTCIANQQILSTQTVADSFIKEKSIIQYTYIQLSLKICKAKSCLNPNLSCTSWKQQRLHVITILL